MEKSFLQKSEEQIQEIIASGNFSLNGAGAVQENEEVVGEMTDREKAMSTLFDKVHKNVRKICEQCPGCDESSIPNDCPQKNGQIETLEFWKTCMWLEIQYRLKIWNGTLAIRTDFQIVRKHENQTMEAITFILS